MVRIQLRNVGLQFHQLMASLRTSLTAPNWAALTVASGVFGERHIRKVEHIKIQMHEQKRWGSGGPSGSMRRLTGSTSRACGRSPIRKTLRSAVSRPTAAFAGTSAE